MKWMMGRKYKNTKTVVALKQNRGNLLMANAIEPLRQKSEKKIVNVHGIGNTFG